MVFKNLDLKNLSFFISVGSITIFTLLFACGFALVSLIRKYGENLPKIVFVTGNKRVPEDEIEDKRAFLRLQFRRNYKFIEAWFGNLKIFLFKFSAIKGVLQLEQNNYVERLVPATFYVSSACNNLYGIQNSSSDIHPKELWSVFLKFAAVGKNWFNFTSSDVEVDYVKAVSSWSCTFADRALLGMYTSQLEKDTLICIDTGKMLRESVLYSAIAPIVDPSDPEFEPLAQAFTKLTDVSHWALGTLGYLNVSIMKLFLKWLMSSEITLVRNLVNKIMSRASPDSSEFKLYNSNKKLFQDQVIYNIITFNSETASHLITSFYDIATHPTLRKQLRQEQTTISLHIDKITVDDPLTQMKLFDLEHIDDIEPSTFQLDINQGPIAGSVDINEPAAILNFSQTFRDQSNLYSYNDSLSQDVPDSTVDSQSCSQNDAASVNNLSTVSSKFTFATENTNELTSNSIPRSHTDFSSNTDDINNHKGLGIESDLINIKNQQGFNPLGVNEYPLNVSGAGYNMLEKCQVYYNTTTELNFLTLNMVRNFSLLNACILESYRVCPPTCSQIWVVKKDISSAFTKHLTLLLSETNTLKRGNILSFCSAAVYELQESATSSDSKVEIEPTREEYSYASTSATNDSEAEQVATPISSYDNFNPIDNWETNYKFQYELHSVLGRNRSYTYDFIRVLLSHLLIRTDFSTFEWGKPKTKDNFLLFTSLYNSSLMFRLQRKFK
ncbi:hypothetical protein BB561_005241 [Smittium simulii]|uniref:Uncharacterized protein n=1 Tax=Smittium simulii TaxID=133385 RepID=A0A2T9YBD4_9FUNG|nr:hypothetical protein BB561_005241 [Smittium simulii]